MKKEKQNSEKGRDPEPEKGSEKKQTSPATTYPAFVRTDSAYGSFQPTLHRKPFEDKSRMPLSSDEYEDDNFEMDGE